MPHVSQMSHVSKKYKALQIMMENISSMANINHMGGQSHLLTLVTKSIDTTSISYHLYAAEGETSPGFAYKNGHPSSS